MLRHKLCYLTACDYDTLYKHRTIFNIRQFPRNLLIRVDDDMFNNFSLYSIEDEDGEEVTNYRYYGKNVIRQEDLDPGFTINPDDEYFLDEGFTNPEIPWEPFVPDDENTDPDNPDSPENPDDVTDPEPPELGEGEVDFPEIDDSGNDDNTDPGTDTNPELPDVEPPDTDVDDKEPTEDPDETPENPDETPGDPENPDETPGDDGEYVDIIDLTVPKDPSCVEIKPINTEILMRPWIELESKWLDTSIGLHNYTLVWENNITKDTHLQYFTYVIQNSKPEKPYVYIKRDTKKPKPENEVIVIGGGLHEEPQEEILDFPVIEYFGEDEETNPDEDLDDSTESDDTENGEELPDAGDDSNSTQPDMTENEDVDNITVYSL